VALNALRDIVFRVPDSVGIGSTWSDSGDVASCRDGAVLTLSIRRTYRVRGAEDRDGVSYLAVDRVSRSTLRGSVARGNDTTIVSGSGEATHRILLDQTTGLVAFADGSGVLDVLVRAPARQESARQVSTLRAARKAP
jgi:hypothetical protein